MIDKNKNKWNKWFLGLAEYISTASKDPSTKVGCVVIGPERDIRSTGYNGFPRGIADDERLNDRNKKYPIIVHAEENAIAQAAMNGVSLKGCSIFVWPLPPCSKCARLLIQSGIKECFWLDQEISERWKEDTERARDLFAEAGVKTKSISKEQ